MMKQVASHVASGNVESALQKNESGNASKAVVTCEMKLFQIISTFAYVRLK